jgi:parvulin-like peptidyl-prolyl isomerase
MTQKGQSEQGDCTDGQSSLQPKLADLDLASAGDLRLNAVDMVGHLRTTLQLEVMKNALLSKIIDAEFVKHGIAATDEEVNEAITQFRLKRHLLTTEACEKWLEDQFLSIDDLYSLSERKVKLIKLKCALFDDDVVDEHFALTKTMRAKVSCYQIVVAKEQKAAEIAALIRDGTSFFDLARQNSEDESTKHACGYTGVKSMSEFEAEIQSAIVAASEGDIVGPIKCDRQFYIVFIDKLYAAKLDRDSIRMDMFRDWSAQQFKTAPMQILV